MPGCKLRASDPESDAPDATEQKIEIADEEDLVENAELAEEHKPIDYMNMTMSGE